MAEHEWGAGRGVDDFVMVTLGTGIGGGIIAEGKLLQGRSGFAGEIGHMVVEAHGIPCPCGGMGCGNVTLGQWPQATDPRGGERGSTPTLLAAHGSAEIDPPRGRHQAGAEGLEEAIDLLRQMSWWLALGLSNLVAVLDSGHFVIGGGLSSASDLVLPFTRDYLANLVEGYQSRPRDHGGRFDVRASSGAMGAAMIAFERDS